MEEEQVHSIGQLQDALLATITRLCRVELELDIAYDRNDPLLKGDSIDTILKSLEVVNGFTIYDNASRTNMISFDSISDFIQTDLSKTEGSTRESAMFLFKVKQLQAIAETEIKHYLSLL